MKMGIHPNYFNEVTVTCSCGTKFVTGSTRETIKVDLCSMCHPFYTGTQKLVDTEGKVEKFTRKRKLASEHKQVAATRQTKEKAERPNTLAEMVAAIRKQQKSS